MEIPEFLHISRALKVFAGTSAGDHQSQSHIRPTHRHVALRLVIEGGFFPEEITPRPPLSSERTNKGWSLKYTPEEETESEATVFGGIKTKKIDVVAAKPGVGPVLAVSVKGTLGAFRNFANRMEEAIGDSTNIHVMYPGLVYGFLALVRANMESEGFSANDIGIHSDGSISPQILRHYNVLMDMMGRKFIRNEYTRYESVGLALVHGGKRALGQVRPDFPPEDSGLRLEEFFPRLFRVYDLRFPLRAPALAKVRRAEWREDSPFFQLIRSVSTQSLSEAMGYEPRIS